MNSWFAFKRAAQDIVSKTITLNLTSERAVLDKTLFRGNELIRGGSDPYHVLRVFTKLLPNARGVSKETLDSDQAALKAIFKASRGTKAVAGAGFGVVGGGTRTRRGAAAYSPSSPKYGYMSTAASPGPSPFGMGVHPPAGMYATASAWGASPAQQPSNARAPRGKARNDRGPVGVGGLRGRAAVGGRGGGGGRSLLAFPATPSGPPSSRAITERADYNSRLQAQQAAIQVDPQGSRCKDCVNAGRNPHQFFGNCAFSECRKCKRGGHRAAKCPFPAFP